jgi:hypothetical protein
MEGLRVRWSREAEKGTSYDGNKNKLTSATVSAAVRGTENWRFEVGAVTVILRVVLRGGLVRDCAMGALRWIDVTIVASH